jgi:hypothetical protein
MNSPPEMRTAAPDRIGNGGKSKPGGGFKQEYIPSCSKRQVPSFLNYDQFLWLRSQNVPTLAIIRPKPHA